jgi:hypothetical protein
VVSTGIPGLPKSSRFLAAGFRRFSFDNFALTRGFLNIAIMQFYPPFLQ